MTNTIKVPSLSTDGWIDSPVKIADNIFSYFFVSDYSQSYIYAGKIVSLPWLIQAGQGNEQKTAELVQTDLNNLFSSYFTDVIVSTSIQSDSQAPNNAILTIYVNFTSEGKSYTLGRLIEVVDLTINKITSINNNGV